MCFLVSFILKEEESLESARDQLGGMLISFSRWLIWLLKDGSGFEESIEERKLVLCSLWILSSDFDKLFEYFECLNICLYVSYSAFAAFFLGATKY